MAPHPATLPMLTVTAAITLAGSAASPAHATTHPGVPSTTASVWAATSTSLPASGVPGVDVSAWSSGVSWRSLRSSGVRFAYVKATEGTYYQSSVASRQLAGARRSGLYIGTYHFANPSQSTGRAQADYFVEHGGDWKPGLLPGAVDLEWNPYAGSMCYGASPKQMASWIGSFQREYRRQTGIWPVIYTTRPWWNTCVAASDSRLIAARSELWLSTSGRTLGSLPTSWTTHRIWQYAYASSGYDIDLFHGSSSRLARLASTGR